MTNRPVLPPSYSLQDAQSALHAGAFEVAEKMARSALSESGNHEGWLSILAAICGMTKRSPEACTYFRQLLVINPNDSAQWSNLGNALCDMNCHEDAIDALHKAIALSPQNAYAHYALARSYQAQGKAKFAIEHAYKAIKINPNDTGFRLLLATLRLWLDDWDGARSELNLLRGKRMAPEQLVDIANLYLQMNMFDDARAAFNVALQFQPRNIGGLIGVGLLDERVNLLSSAQNCVDKAIAEIKDLRTNENSSWLPALNHLMAKLSFRRKDFRQSADALTHLLSPPPNDPMLHSHLCFELGASLDKLREYDSAWKAFTTAHSVRADHLTIGYKGIAGSDLSEIIETPAPVFSINESLPISDNRKDPIFIVGFPRSGTTLLEQILDSQPDLASFDEQSFLQRLLVELRKHSLNYPQDLSNIDRELNSHFRNMYFDYVDSVVPNLGMRQPVDKNPLNLVRMPFAQGFLPNSKVIIAIRHPCDVVLSCYMQSFRTPVLQTSFSSLEATAELYAKVMKCWRNFRSDLRLPVHINRYEDLVTDPVSATKQLAAFLELPWNESWLDAAAHVRTKSAIRTPSYAQVAEPINQNANGRWLNYRKYFSETTLNHLAPWISEFGYPDAK